MTLLQMLGLEHPKPVVKESARTLTARLLIGEDRFWGMKEWGHYYGSKPPYRKIVYPVPEFPWSAAVLNSPCPFFEGKMVQETHFAFLGIPMYRGNLLTIVEWQRVHGPTCQPRFSTGCGREVWFYRESFAAGRTCEFRWYLSLLLPVPGTVGKNYREQIKMVPAEYEVASAVAEVTKHILYHRKNRTYPITFCRWARCQDLASNGERVFVGSSDSEGLDINRWTDTDGDLAIGIAVTRGIGV